jgi:hypothetical protein
MKVVTGAAHQVDRYTLHPPVQDLLTGNVDTSEGLSLVLLGVIFVGVLGLFDSELAAPIISKGTVLMHVVLVAKCASDV